MGDLVLTPPGKSLIARIAEACDAVKGIEKKGKNEFQNYKYVKAADVAKAIRHEFFTRNVLLVIDEKEFVEIGKIPTKSGNPMPLMLLKCEVTFYDGDGDGKLGPFGAFGTAADSGDKSVYKCKTGALKYVLRSIGLIPDEKDDPEADEEVDAQTAGTVSHKTKKYEDEFDQRERDQSDKVLTPFQQDGIRKMAAANGRTDSQLIAYMKAEFGVDRVEKVLGQHFEKFKAFALNQLPIQEELAASVKPNGNHRTLFAQLQGEPDTVEVTGVPAAVEAIEKNGKKWLAITMHDGAKLSDWHLDHEATIKEYLGKDIIFLATVKGKGDKTYYNVDSLEVSA